MQGYWEERAWILRCHCGMALKVCSSFRSFQFLDTRLCDYRLLPSKSMFLAKVIQETTELQMGKTAGAKTLPVEWEWSGVQGTSWPLWRCCMRLLMVWLQFLPDLGIRENGQSML